MDLDEFDLNYILAAIKDHDIVMLTEKIRYLKGTDGEGWAVGEMLERALFVMLTPRVNDKNKSYISRM